jgi:tripartite-type tricarboxylate transporter receptor subunit TctC
MFDNIPSSIAFIRNGGVRALAVSTAARSEQLPELPPISDVVPGYEASGWNGVGAPKDTPPEIIALLNREINAALVDTEMHAQLAELGGTAAVTSPGEFEHLIIDETEKWTKVVKFAGIKPG